MSNYEWEEGTIMLPTAAAPKVRDAVKAVAEKYRQRLYDDAQTFWKALPAGHKRDAQKYCTAIHAFTSGNSHDVFDQKTKAWTVQPLDPKLPRWKGFGTDNEERAGYGNDLSDLLRRVLRENKQVTRTGYDGKPYTMNEWVERPPRRVQWPDVNTVITKPVGTKFAISCGEGHLRFEGRKLHWSVPENNHARDYGREHPIAKALFAALENVTWTRGSGGQIVGNDEYTRDSRESGGGGNYVVTDYGPHIKKAPKYNPYNAYGSGSYGYGRSYGYGYR